MAPPQSLSPVASSAGYGRSCTNCSKAKCKCILRPGGQICERCYRLRKDCQPMVSARKRTVKKTSSSRTAQLEEKLDDLVSILRASQSQPYSQQGQDEQQPTTQVTRQDNNNMSSAPTDSRHFPSRLDSLATAATSSPSATNTYKIPNTPIPQCIVPEPGKPAVRRAVLPHEPPPLEANARLDKFRKWLPYLGYLYIPPDLKAEDLKRDRPVLYSVIMNLTSMDVTEQQAMGEAIRKDIVLRAYMDNERSMDLLLAILTFLSWAHFNTSPLTKPFIVPHSQLAHALIFDLGLNKSLKEEQHFTACFKIYGPPKGAPPARPSSRPRTTEEMRAVLGMWFQSSLLAMFIGKMDPLRWTSHMDECLETLERAPEVPSDETLAVLIRLQRISHEAQEHLLRDAMADGDGTPTFMFRKGLKERLNIIRSRIRPDIMAQPQVQSFVYSTEMQVESVGLFVDSEMPESSRIDGMYAMVKALRSWYELFLNMPPEEIPGMPFSFFIQFTQTHVVLYKLAVSNDPAWDKSYFRSTADPMTLFDRSVERFQQIGVVYPMKSSQEAPTIFAKGATMVSHIKASWEPVMTAALGGLPTPESSANNPNSATMGMTPSMPVDPNVALGDPSAWDFGDMGWMTDVFGPWEF